MSAQTVYLDTSAIVKRYVTQEESNYIDEIYDRAYSGKLKIGFPIWNIGEVATILSKYEKKGILKDCKEVFEIFLGETRLLTKLEQLIIIPLSLEIIIKATSYIFKHKIYIADAIQLASAIEFDGFITYDKTLTNIAKSEGLKLII